MPVVKYDCGCIGIPIKSKTIGACVLIHNCEGVGEPMEITTNQRKIEKELNAQEIQIALDEIQELIQDGKNLRKLKSWMRED